MAITGRRLTAVLVVLLTVLAALGGAVAWSLGRDRAAGEPSPAGYVSGPTADRTVQLAPAAAEHPRAAEIQQLLQRYFDAINDRDHRAWTGTVSAAQSAGQPADRWRESYSTTVDSNIMVAEISDEPLRARVMFTSNQEVRYAPPALPATCIEWDLTYMLATENDTLVLSGLDPSAPDMAACD